jgi:hypothetical protein
MKMEDMMNKQMAVAANALVNPQPEKPVQEPQLICEALFNRPELLASLVRECFEEVAWTEDVLGTRLCLPKTLVQPHDGKSLVNTLKNTPANMADYQHCLLAEIDNFGKHFKTLHMHKALSPHQALLGLLMAHDSLRVPDCLVVNNQKLFAVQVVTKGWIENFPADPSGFPALITFQWGSCPGGSEKKKEKKKEGKQKVADRVSKVVKAEDRIATIEKRLSNRLDVATKPEKKQAIAKARLAKGKEIANARDARVKKGDLSSKIGKMVEDIMGSYTLPAAHRAVRYNDGMNEFETAISSPWAQFTATWYNGTSYSSTKQQLPANNTQAFVFRDIVRNFVVYDGNPSGLIMNYTGYFPVSGSINWTALFSCSFYCVNSDFCPIAFLTNAAYSPHGTYLYTGNYGNHRYVWIDKGCTISYSFSGGTSTGSSDKMEVYQYDTTDKGINTSLPITWSSGSASISFTAPSSAYYGFLLTTLTGSFNVSCTLADPNSAGNGVSHFCHLPAPGFENNKTSIGSYRLGGSAIQYANTASVMNLEGNIYGLQAPSADSWQEYVNDTTKVPSSEGVKRLNAEKGIYGFYMPRSKTEIGAWKDQLLSEGGQMTSVSYNLKCSDDYLVVQVDCPDNSSKVGVWLNYLNVEYRTTDVWRNTDVARIGPEVYETAVSSLKNVVQWHENPTHLEDIWNSIKSSVLTVAGAVEKYGPTAISLAKTISGFLA